jgi:hypothetical protein
MQYIYLCFSGLFIMFSSAYSQIIPDFQVNENAGPNGAVQWSCSISADSSGNFVITWQDERNGVYDIYAQRYSSNGIALGDNFKVTDNAGSIIGGYGGAPPPSISTDGSGNFVVTWTDMRNDDPDIYAQRYSSDGSALGTNFKVNDDHGSARQWFSFISTDGSGNFVITWMDERNGDSDIYAQRYSSDGTILGPNFRFNFNHGNHPIVVSMDSTGNFVLTWYDGENIYAQRFTNTGAAIDSNFIVNEERDIAMVGDIWPAICTNYSGNFVIVWMDYSDGISNIYAQRYKNDGTALGANFKVDDDSLLSWKSGVALDPKGNFVITWWADFDYYAQRYSSDGTALGSNFKVNDDVGSLICGYGGPPPPSILTNGSGNFVITWTDGRNGDSDIYAQRYSSDGIVLGSNFKINDDEGSSSQNNSSISTDSFGNFIITWDDERKKDNAIYAQRFTIDGMPIGENFEVNDNSSFCNSWDPSLAIDESGNFIITWRDNRHSDSNIFAQYYSSDGIKDGENFKVNYEGGRYDGPENPSISTDKHGNFVIAWKDMRNNGGDIYAQRFSRDGIRRSTNFKVNDYDVIIRQANPSVSCDDTGNFVITWADERNGKIDVYAQRFSSNGLRLSSNFKVNDAEGSVVGIPSPWVQPSISTDGNANFVITWTDERNGNRDIYAQRYSNDGTALGTNFRVNDDQGHGGQQSPSVSADGSGNFVITWMDERNGDSDIYAQRYSSDGIALDSNFIVTNFRDKNQSEPDVKLWNGRIYNSWTDNRAGGTGYDIWANVLDWENPVGIDENENWEIPVTYSVSQNYPNPFNPSTKITFTLPKPEHVALDIYNTLGQKVATLLDSKINAGSHDVQFDASNLPSGIYFYRIQAGEFSQVRKMVLLR